MEVTEDGEEQKDDHEILERSSPSNRRNLLKFGSLNWIQYFLELANIQKIHEVCLTPPP